MRYVALLITTLSLFVFLGCSIMDSGYFFRNKSVTVSSCPTNIYVTVNNMECQTPCKLKFPSDTAALEVKYQGMTTVVPVSQSGLSGYDLTGQLVIMNPNNIGSESDAPNNVYFLRDYDLGQVDACGSVGEYPVTAATE